MLYDSVFTLAAPFPRDRPLMSEREIERGLDAIEGDTQRDQARVVERAIDALVDRALPLVERGDLKGIQALEVPALRAELEKPIFEIWRRGFELGQRHGQKEIIKGLPKEDRALFTLTPRQRDALARLINQDNETLISVGAEQSILQRVLRLAGNFSDDTINRLKNDLIASIIPQASGDPISRRELLERIQTTLEVGSNRAQMIARTETTNAYNAGRMTTFRESRIVSHVRFLAILDNRTTTICLSRNGLVWEIDDPAVNENRPPLHVNCRSVISPLMPSINPAHEEMATDPKRDPSNQVLESLPKGWRS